MQCACVLTATFCSLTRLIHGHFADHSCPSQANIDWLPLRIHLVIDGVSITETVIHDSTWQANDLRY